ncbi:hypothetical protein, partial [Thiolapillus sp.]
KLLLHRICLVLLLTGTPMAYALNESEPNDTPASAQDLGKQQGLTSVSGSIGIAGDTDVFEVHGFNPFWGFVAVLDTSASTTDKLAKLSVYGSDGSTLLQQDQNGWKNGSVLA